MRSRRLLAALLTPLLTLPLATGLTAGAAGAARAQDELGLSLDGSHWSSSIPAVLPQGRLVPGRSVEGTFAVKNRGASDAVLRAEASTTDGDQLIASGALGLHVQFGSGGWQELEAGHLLLPADGWMKQGEVVPGVVRASLQHTAGNLAQDRAAAFSIRLVLTQADLLGGGVPGHELPGAGLLGTGLVGSGVLGTDGQQGGPADPLPSTGAETSRWWVVAGAVLLGAGLALVGRRRRSTERTDRHTWQGAAR